MGRSGPCDHGGGEMGSGARRAAATGRDGARNGGAGRPRRAMLRSSAIGACTLGAGAVLSACTGDRSWPDTGSDGGGASGGDPGAGRKARTSAPPGPQQIARTLVTTLEEHSSLVRDLQRVDLSGTLGAPVTYPRPAGARGLAEALDVTTSKLLRESRFRDAGKGAAPTVSARMIVSAASVLGVLLDVVNADGALRLLFPAAPYAKGHAEALVEVPAAHGATLLSELGKQIRAAIAEPDEFDPGQVTVPMPEDHHGEDSYDPDEPVTPAHPARETSSPGPRTQLAPLAEPGTAPSAVTAPDAHRLRTVSLTFDDGPSPELNETLRSHLTARGAAATFFFIGQSVKAAPKPCAATAADGHEIGGHSWSHADLSRASDERLEREMDRTTRVITEVTGRTPSHMRPRTAPRTPGWTGRRGSISRACSCGAWTAWTGSTATWTTTSRRSPRSALVGRSC